MYEYIMLVKQRTHFRDSRKKSGTDMSSGGSIFGSILGALSSETAKSIGKSAVEGVSKGVQKGAEEAGRRAITHVVDKATRGKKGKKVTLLTGTTGEKVLAPEEIDERTRRLLNALKGGSGIKTIY